MRRSERITGVCETAVLSGLLVGVIAFAWRLGRDTARLTRLKPRGAFCAETSAAISILIATFLRQPVSTTHVIAGSIAGVGSIQRVRAVRWGLMQDIVWAWILTIPASAAIAGVAFSAIHLFQSF